jgi:type I restriction enzyme, R subunit
MEYGHERAVADGVNVDYDVYRIATKITGEGSKIDKGFYIDTRDKLSRARRWEQLDQDLEYVPVQLDRSVVAPDQIRTVIKTFKEALPIEIFPGRTEVPKTLVFAKDDSHAEDIVHIIREEFGKGNDFCKKITYRTMEDTDRLIASFRNSYHPRIAVTVDMISTGTDIKPLECLIFMRDVRSLTYFEQMKGRGTRTITSTDIEMVTPDTKCKDHFVIVDAVGVCENDKTESRPLEKKKGVSFEKLLFAIAAGKRDKDSLSSLASRLARLNREINQKDRKEIEDAAGGKKLPELISTLLESIDPDKKIETAKKIYKTEAPTEEQIINAGVNLAQDACKPFDSPNLRNTLVVIQKRNQQIIDTVSKDEVIYAGFDPKAKEKAKSVIDTFKKFIADNKDELTAYQLIYSKPYSQREGTYEEIKKIADTIQKPPYHLTQEKIWQAYRELEKSKVRGTPQKVLTNIISLLRFETGSADMLEPFTEIVNKRFQEWLAQQEKAGNTFTPEQMEWLILIKDHIATSLSIGNEDFEYAPFYEKGGQIKVVHLFGGKLNKILTELNEVLTA